MTVAALTAGAPTPLLLEAYCVINPFGSKREAEILAALGRPVAVAARVAQVEALDDGRAIHYLRMNYQGFSKVRPGG